MSIIHEALTKTQEKISSRESVVSSPAPKGLKRFAVSGGGIFVLSLCLVAAVGYYISTGEKHDDNRSAAGKHVPEAQIEVAKSPVERTDDNVVPDALSSPVSSPLKVVFRLNGTMISSQGSSAIINNAIVHEGDSVQGAEVVEIGENSVRLKLGDEDIRLQN